MIRRGGVMSAAMAVLAVAGLVRADMMSAANLEAVAQSAHCVVPRRDSVSSIPSEPSLAFSVSEAWCSYSLDLPGLTVGESASEKLLPQVLVDRSNSFDLCLYALVSLGVLRSGCWVRRPSLGVFPEWYQGVALELVGCGCAAGPDALSMAGACFIQPDGRIDPTPPKQRRGTIVCLWRGSMYTPAVLAGRAPPRLS
jgi:hypothetical protein